MMLNALYSYITIGLVTAISMFLTSYRPKSEFGKAIDEVLYGKRSWHYKLREAMVIPGAIVLIVLVWPIALWMLAADRLKSRAQTQQKNPEELFAAQQEFLKEKLTIEQIEVRELYQDPLRITPNLPFGHLNTAWVEFKLQLQNGDELWSFVIPQNQPMGLHALPSNAAMAGYAIIRNKKIAGEFVCEANGDY
jgi:hypothetical protein